jgi:hypothetical protein
MNRMNMMQEPAGWTCPPDDDGPTDVEQERALRDLADQLIGDDCAGVAGHNEGAELELNRWLAKLLKAPPCFRADPAAIGTETLRLVRAWRQQIEARVSDDDIRRYVDKARRDFADELREGTP